MNNLLTFSELLKRVLELPDHSCDLPYAWVGSTHHYAHKAKELIDSRVSKGINPKDDWESNMTKNFLRDMVGQIESGTALPAGTIRIGNRLSNTGA